MAWRGNLRDFSLTQLLNLISLGKKTGALTLTKGENQATLYFRKGVLLHLSLDGQGPDLRSLLKKAGKINEAQNPLLPQEARSDKEWGLLLINARLVERADIMEVIRRHTLEMVYDLFTWSEGEFLFKPNILPPDDAITVPIHLENIVLEGADRQGSEEEAPLTSG